MGSSQGDFIPLLWSVFILLIVGVAILPLVSVFSQDEPVPYDYGAYTYIADRIEYGIDISYWVLPSFITSTLGLSLPHVQILPFMPNIRSFIADDIRAFNYIPTYVGLPIIVFVSVAFMYSIIKIAQGFIP